MNSAHRLRLSAAALTLMLAAPLSGCFAEATAHEAPTADEKPLADDVTIEDKGDIANYTMSFEDGETLTAPAIVEWTDDLAGDAGWTLTSPDDGEGSWQYTSADGTCTTDYWQGEMLDMVAADDRAASDFVISALTGLSSAELATRVEDRTLGYIFGENPTAAYRSFSSVSSERSWVIATRGFAALSAVAVLIVDCSSDRAENVAQSVIASSAFRVSDSRGTVELE